MVTESLEAASQLEVWLTQGETMSTGETVLTLAVSTSIHHDGLKISKEGIADLLDTIIICHLARGCKGHYSSSHHTESLP